MDIGIFLTVLNFVFSAVIAVYFLGLLKTQQSSKSAIDRESRKELAKLRQLRTISLTEPLSEKTRPQSFDDVVGQDQGIQLLRAALCGPNPQHVLIYGPPGVGKTAVARLVLEEAKCNPASPFGPSAKFIELDAATARFDERGIADPLIGSVHDPIYQGAGAMGVAGIPQPKPGAVTKAHGGILFLDEIGELHHVQMNKLLKVLEDRKVLLESAYYSSEDKNVPEHIHEIFTNGLPADFRLVGATTRLPQEIPAAIRSRCLEIFFRELTPQEIVLICEKACDKVGIAVTREATEVVSRYARNGREAVNMVQIAVGRVREENRESLIVKDIEWVVNSIHATPRLDKRIVDGVRVGVVNGVAVHGPNLGMLIDVEVVTGKVNGEEGRLKVTGVVQEEELGGAGRTIRRKSMASDSVENVMTALKQFLGDALRSHDIHINFPGGIPVDGPSAGIAMATAIYSSVRKIPIDNRIAMTGELSIHGRVKPVGGVTAKIHAAKQAGVTKFFVPHENWQQSYADYMGLQIIPVNSLEEVFRDIFFSYDMEAHKLSASSTD